MSCPRNRPISLNLDYVCWNPRPCFAKISSSPTGISVAVSLLQSPCLNHAQRIHRASRPTHSQSPRLSIAVRSQLPSQPSTKTLHPVRHVRPALPKTTTLYRVLQVAAIFIQ